jgi:ABC-2 type transport system ATP-binding protein
MTHFPVISLRDVRKSYGGFELGPVDLEIEAGYVVAIVGPNGGGKSTLIRMLMNLVQPTSGETTLFGGTYPDDEVAIKRRVAYVPERSVGHDEMSAKSLGEFVSRFYPTWDHRLYEDFLNRPGIDPDKGFGKLSKGVQRRLAFALAVAAGSELLLLDEPTAGVDPFARREMLEDISRFMHDGAPDGDRTVVFATHVMEEVRRIADYVAFLVDGVFLGLHEKDALLDRWKTFWVDREPVGDVPGIVEVHGASPARIVSGSPHETAQALSAQNIRIVRSGALDLEEILSHLMRRRREGQFVASRVEGRHGKHQE